MSNFFTPVILSADMQMQQSDINRGGYFSTFSTPDSYKPLYPVVPGQPLGLPLWVLVQKPNITRVKAIKFHTK